MVSAKSAIENYEIIRLDYGTLFVRPMQTATVKDGKIVTADDPAKEERGGWAYAQGRSNTGYLYTVVATPMGSATTLELGGEFVVSLLSPHQAVAVMNPFHLTASYVSEKFAHALYPWRPDDLVCVTRTIGLALGIEDDADTAYEYLEKQ